MNPEGKKSPQTNKRVRLKDVYLTTRPFGINSPTPPPSADSSEEPPAGSAETERQEDSS